MKALYFGPYSHPGHFMFLPGGERASAKQEADCPWKAIDGVLQPHCRIRFLRWSTEGPEVEGEGLVHYREGWTALSFWDRTIDTRGACNSTFFFDVPGLDFEGIVKLAAGTFPDRWERMRFIVKEVELANNSLICDPVRLYRLSNKAVPTDFEDLHYASIVHRTGGVSAEVLNACAHCGQVIANWNERWVTVDGWSEQAIRDGRKFE